MTDINFILNVLEEDNVFGSIPDGSVVLVEASEQLVSHLAPVLISQLGYSLQVILLLTDKSFVDVARDYKANKVDPQNITVLDCTSKKYGKPIQEDAHHLFLEDVTDLEAMFTNVFAQVDAFKGRGFLCIDTLNELILANGEMNIAKVLHVILTKLRSRKIGCLMVSVQNSMVEVVRAEVVQLFDKVIHL